MGRTLSTLSKIQNNLLIQIPQRYNFVLPSSLGPLLMPLPSLPPTVTILAAPLSAVAAVLTALTAASTPTPALASAIPPPADPAGPGVGLLPTCCRCNCEEVNQCTCRCSPPTCAPRYVISSRVRIFSLRICIECLPSSSERAEEMRPISSLRLSCMERR